MTTEDLKENKISLAQGIGFALTILIFMITGYVSISSRLAVTESKQQEMEQGMDIMFEVSREVTEIKVSLKFIEKELKEMKEDKQ